MTVRDTTDWVRINGIRVNIIGKLAEEGACRDKNPDLFFPEVDGELTIFEANKQAKAICAECPVAGLCLDYAVVTGQYGTWGGTTFRERKHLKDEDTRDEYIRMLRWTKGEGMFDFDSDDEDDYDL